jgi:hypothetical protein
MRLSKHVVAIASLATLPALAILVVGCRFGDDADDAAETAPPEPRRSAEVGTDRLLASYGAFAGPDKLEIFVAFLVDDDKSGFARLVDGDAVTATVSGATVPLRERVEKGKVHYIGELLSPPDEPVVSVTFARAGNQSTATVNIGPKFDVVGPPSRITLGETLSIDVTPRPDLSKWPPSAFGPALRHVIVVYGSCVENGTQAFEPCKPGTQGASCQIEYPLTWSTSATKLVEGQSGCDADVEVRLESASARFEGAVRGGFEGLQFRKFRAAIAR